VNGGSLRHFPLASTPAESQCATAGSSASSAVRRVTRHELPIRNPDLDQRLLVIGPYEHVVRAGDPPSIRDPPFSRAPQGLNEALWLPPVFDRVGRVWYG
jgi:hypothetical protein